MQLYSKTTESSVDKGALDGTLPAALLSASQKSREKSETGLRSAGSGVSGAVRALTGDELRQKKIQSGRGSRPD